MSSTSIVLPARRRTLVGKSAANVRRTKRVPAVLYGHGVTNQNLDIDDLEFQKVLRQAGTSSLVDLVIENQAPVRVLIHAIQRHPTVNAVTHVDFYQVKMSEKLETDIDLHFVGESTAVKEQGGILVRAVDKIMVSCLPADLVPAIEVDISVLRTFDDHIAIKDLKIPSGLTVLDDGGSIVATVKPPRSEDELKELEAAPTEDVSTVEKVEKAKVEDEDEETATTGTPPAKEK